jgi:hypothetical protein
MGKRIGKFGLVNYVDHPTQKNYKVFSFNTLEEAALFENMLQKDNIWFERDEELVKDKPLYLFGVENKHFDKAQQANFMVSAQLRKHIIKNKFLKYALLLFVLTTVIIAIVGYVKNSAILYK